MKKILTIAALSAALLSGCSEKLDVSPTQSVDETFVFTTDANIKAALNGAYDIFSGGFVTGGDMQLYAELLGAGGEISWVGTYNQPDEIYNKSILTTNSYVRDTYLEGYRLINVCNNIIANISKVNSADQNSVKGQALFLRGTTYFELVKLFAKPYSAGNVTSNPGLQIVTAPTVNGQVATVNYTPRSTVEQTYQQILNDLTEAKSIIGGEPGVYGNEYAVSAVLSRVYLQMENFEEARDEANHVIENSGASLEADYASAFNNTAPSTEDILALPVTAQDGTNDLHLFFSILDFGARDGDVEVNQDHIDLYEAGDARLSFFYLDDYSIYRSGKWKIQYRYLPLIRLAEMYLTRAEANARLGTSVGATPDDDLNNMIRSRAGLSPVTADVPNILYERRLELAHEGHRIHEIKRLRESVDGFDFDANELVFPIPLREINASNGVLIQNPGY